jgi:hypothetical protein
MLSEEIKAEIFRVVGTGHLALQGFEEMEIIQPVRRTPPP